VKRRTLRLIILFASLLLGALIVIQVIWVQRAYKLQETQVTYDIAKSLVEVSRQIQEHAGDSTFLLDPIRQIDDNTFIVKTNETLDPFYAEQVLTHEFKNQEINLDFEYNLYNCFNDSVIYTKAVYINEGIAQEKEKPSVEVNWKSDDGHYFSVYFPNKSDIVLGRLTFWYYSSFLLVVMILFFAYTISIIFKQKRLSEVKTDFINNMTHELKTPISTIALSSDVLLRPDIIEKPEKLKNYATIINRENQRLQRQVEKVLEIASLEKDKVELSLTTIDLHAMINEVVQTFEPSINDKNGHFITKLLATNCTVEGDVTHLNNVLVNLIDNAIKYCEVAPIIEISSQNIDNKIVIEITDNGIGISNEMVKLIFDKFYRVPTGNIHNVKGFGLGLYYVKTMVQEHSGKISAVSNPNKGSNFTLTLPLLND
jgi:two-component system phosphate regulon sensor histidine kinase PhoR